MEHAYWGGARDRIPASQTDAMVPLGAPELVRDGALVTVRGHEHLCLIRSGQDWSDTEADERRMYLDDVEPVLRAGMDFLRDDGRRSAASPIATRSSRPRTAGRPRRATA
jgi:aldoxime dehydratase